MRNWLVIFLAAAMLLVAGCSSATNADAEIAPREGEIAELKAQMTQKDAELATKEREIAELKEELTSAKKSLAMAPPPPNQDSVAAGEGAGRFVVIPSKVRPGFPIGIFNDEGGGEIRITRVRIDAGRIRIDKEVGRMAGPRAGQILVYTIPKDLDPGSYLIQFYGHGGTYGEAVIQVDATEETDGPR